MYIKKLYIFFFCHTQHITTYYIINLLTNRKTVETEEKPETPNQSISQSTANVSTSAPAESTSASTSKESESKDGGSGEATDAVNSSLNESTSKPLKEADNLKRPLVEEDEEVKPKKRKEDSQNSKGDLLVLNLISHFLCIWLLSIGFKNCTLIFNF